MLILCKRKRKEKNTTKTRQKRLCIEITGVVDRGCWWRVLVEGVGKCRNGYSTPQPPHNTHPFQHPRPTINTPATQSTPSTNSLFNTLNQHPSHSINTLIFQHPQNQHHPNQHPRPTPSINNPCNFDTQSLLSGLGGIFFFSFSFT